MTKSDKAADDNTEQTAAEEQGTEATPTEPVGLQILGQYVRDLSFENPGAPNFAPSENQNVNINANVGARKFSDTDYEVSLKFKITATADEDKTQFIAELDYCGVFRLMNIPENDIRPVLLIEAPRQLFPFARRILADATRDGGYPPVMLDPIDFLQLYRKGQEEEAANGEGAEADGENAIN